MSAHKPDPDEIGAYILRRAEALGAPLKDDPDLAAAYAGLEPEGRMPEELGAALAAILDFLHSAEHQADSDPPAD